MSINVEQRHRMSHSSWTSFDGCNTTAAETVLNPKAGDDHDRKLDLVERHTKIIHLLIRRLLVQDNRCTNQRATREKSAKTAQKKHDAYALRDCCVAAASTDITSWRREKNALQQREFEVDTNDNLADMKKMQSCHPACGRQICQKPIRGGRVQAGKAKRQRDQSF